MGKMKYLICMFLAILLAGCIASKKSELFLEYDRTGGLIGLNDHLTIDFEGNAVLKRKNSQTEFKLDIETLKRVGISLNNANFTQLNQSYSPSLQGADLIEYTITYNGHSVQMTDTAVPEIMQPILDSLNQIIDNSGK
jgi:uncharacterized lipoprotein YehR (DUF1307 family)